MNNAAFWKIIDESLEEAEGDLDEQMEFLGEALEELDPEEIVEFDRIFLEYWVKAYTWDLWAAAYILGKGCSDDEFVDFLGWLICRGEKVYELALKNADSLVNQLDADAGEDALIEGFQGVATLAWEHRTGKSLDDFPEHQVELPKEPKGTPWSESGDDLKTRFPKLYRKFF